MPVRRTLLALLLCAPAAWAADAKTELKTLKQEVIAGDLVSMSSKEIVIARGGEKTTVPIDQVLSLTFGQSVGNLPNVPWSDVELTDGTMLHCAKVSIADDQVEVALLAGPTAKFPLECVYNVLSNAHVEKNRKRWDEILNPDQKRAHDVLAAYTKDGDLNPVEGTIGKINDKGEISFTIASSGTEKKPNMSAVAGMIFDRKPAANPPPVQCRLYDTHRDLVVVSAGESSPNGFTATTPSGAKIEYTTALVAKMDYSKGKLDFLSDMTPIKVTEACVGAEDSVQHYHANVNLDDKPIRVGNVQYDKGLALHAYTELVYDLKGEYREFKAVAGLDDDVKGDDRPVQLVIECDGVPRVKQTISRKDKEKPPPITLNVKDVRKLRIVVSRASGALLDLGLRLNLADAQVSK
jgi:hypothetical protein